MAYAGGINKQGKKILEKAQKLYHTLARRLVKVNPGKTKRMLTSRYKKAGHIMAYTERIGTLKMWQSLNIREQQYHIKIS
jgi:hypothetical protein